MPQQCRWGRVCGRTLRRQLQVDTVLEASNGLDEFHRLLAEEETAGAIDQVKLRGALALGDHLEQDIAGFSGRRGVVTGPDDLRRHREILAQGFPYAAFDRANAEVLPAQLFVLHRLRRIAVRLTGCSLLA